MISLDLKKIRGDNSEGQRIEFEKFVCSLARRETPNGTGWEFRRVEGSGGDGGVEAYWFNVETKEKLGYQAKYFTRAGKIDWQQIDHSVKTALETHPELTKYTIALACCLTGKSGKKGKGKSGWEHWDTHKKKWQDWATKKNCTLDFGIWAASELEELARAKLGQGSLKYWFNADFLKPCWFVNHIKSVHENLGKRYSPNIHTNTLIEGKLSLFLRQDDSTKSFKKRIDEFISRIQDVPIFTNQDRFSEVKKRYLKKLKHQEEKLKDSPLWNERVFDDWSIEERKTLMNEMYHSLNNFPQELAQLKHNFPYRFSVLDNILSEIGIREEPIINSKCFCISGDAGIGKSHTLGHLANLEVQKRRPIIMLLGQYFQEGRSPKEQIPTQLGLSDLSFENLLEALDTAAQSAEQIGLIIIDALNEGDGLSLWPNRINSLINQVRKFKHLKLILSCRNQYEDQILCDINKTEFYSHRLPGLTEEERKDFCRAVIGKNIPIPHHLSMLPILKNPLFLIAVSESLKQSGKTEFPSDLNGALQLLEHHVNFTIDDIIKINNLSKGIASDLKEAYKALAVLMIDKKSIRISKKDIIEKIDDIICSGHPNGKNWLDIFIESGAFRRTPVRQKSNQGDLICYNFQGFEDFLIADKICKNPGGIDFILATDDNDVFYIDTQWQGVATAFGVILAENDGTELIDLFKDSQSIQSIDWKIDTTDGYAQESQSTFKSAFINGLILRSPSSISPRTTELLETCPNRLKIISNFTLIPDHPWNADYLHNILINCPSMAERDAFWSVLFMDNSISYNDVIEKDIQPNTPDYKETYRLTAITLCWLFTTTNHRLRDKATKKLAEIFKLYPDLMLELLQQFKDVNDPYVLERLLAATYATCCLLESKDVGKIAKVVYYSLFADKKPPYHLLIRDYALAIIERAEHINELPSGISLKNCRPPFISPWPLDSYTNDQINKIAKSIEDHSIEMSLKYNSDFDKYTLQPNVNNFSNINLSASIPSDFNKFEYRFEYRFDGELISNWVAHRVYSFGWTKKLFPNDVSKYYNGSQRPVIERIGKKYQWIAMYDLLGILSDHVFMCEDWSRSKKYKSALDMDFCRDIDPTTMTQQDLKKDAKLEQVELKINLPEDSDYSTLTNWIKKTEGPINIKNIVVFTDGCGKRWYQLYAFASAREDNRGSFFRLSTNCLDKGDFQEFIDNLCGQRLLDSSHPNKKETYPPTDKFAYEMDWRYLKNDLDWDEDDERIPRHSIPVQAYHWGSDNLSLHLPADAIIKKFNLRLDREHPNVMRDIKGECKFYCSPRNIPISSLTSCCIDADLFDEFLDENGLTCVWTLGSDCVWTLGSDRYHRGVQGRDFSSIAWRDKKGVLSKSWYEDS